MTRLPDHLAPAIVPPAPARRRPAPEPLRRCEIAYLRPDGGIAELGRNIPARWPFEAAVSACARGSLVQSVSGPVAVEDLLPGDEIETSAGPQVLLWTGSTLLVPGRRGETGLTHLTRICAETFGPGRPVQDLLLGPGARLRLRSAQTRDAGFVPVDGLADGTGIVTVTPPTAVRLTHLVFPRHAGFRVNGMEIESYHPGAAALATMPPAVRAVLLSMFPGIDSLTAFGPAGPFDAPEAPPARTGAA